MARIRTKPNIRRTLETNQQDKWARLVDRILSGNYVLVVGSEIVLSKDIDLPVNGDSTQYALQTVVQSLKDEQWLHEQYQCQTFTELSKKVPNLHKLTAKYLEEGVGIEYNEADISVDLLNLLKTRCFRVVITTTFDKYIEKAMRLVWGDELRIMNIFDVIGPDKDFTFDEQHLDDYCDIRPTLYYAFGRIDAERNYVLTENDAIQIMARWLSHKTQPRFMNYISGKRILAVGCKLEDWLFRFFWYALQQDISKLMHGEVAITLDLENSQPDKSLNRYLTQNDVYVYPNAHEFISNLVSSLSQTFVPDMSSVRDQRKHGGVFISYASEDKTIALQVFNALIDRGIDVWIDEAKLGDERENDYNRRIAVAIEECKVFIPLFSSQIICDFQQNRIVASPNDMSNEDMRYYSKEWWIAEKAISHNTIKPIALYGYECRNELHKQIFAEQYPRIYASTAFSLHKQPFCDFILAIETILRDYDE